MGKFYIDSLVHDEKALRYLIDLVGKEKIALGSDYPFPLGEASPGALIKASKDITKSEKDWLLWKSAAHWLGISKEEYV